MIRIFENRKFYTKETFYLASKEDFISAKSSADMIHTSYCDFSLVGNGIIDTPCYSARIDLLQDVEEIQSKFTKTLKYEINRAKKDGITVKFYFSSDIRSDVSILSYLKSEYKHFCETNDRMQILSYFDMPSIERFVEQNALCVSRAEFEGGNVYHIYYCDGVSTRLWFSYSSLAEELQDRNLLGRANKYLHNEDILLFKEKGYSIYDWGGLFNPDGKNGIDKFKLSFGAESYEAHSIIKAITFKGRILVILFKLKQLLLAAKK